MPFENEAGDYQAPFSHEDDTDADSIQDDPDAADGATEEPLTLEAFEGDTRAQVERLVAQQTAQYRSALQEVGLDLNREGKPLVADASKVAQWAPQPQRYAPQPDPTPQPQPAQGRPDADQEEEFDMLSATPTDLARFVTRQNEKTNAPLLDEIRRLSSLVSQQYQGGAIASVRSAVEARAPEIAPWLDHPDFDGLYRQYVQGADPALLHDPETVAGIAALVRLKLDASRLPAPRDDQGRFVAQQQAEARALNAANRAGLSGTPPGRGGGVQRGGRDPHDVYGQRFLEHFRGQLPPNVKRSEVSPEDAWDDLSARNIDEYKANLARRSAAGNGRRR